jgi:hypothetical protein
VPAPSDLSFFRIIYSFHFIFPKWKNKVVTPMPASTKWDAGLLNDSTRMRVLLAAGLQSQAIVISGY